MTTPQSTGASAGKSGTVPVTSVTSFLSLPQVATVGSSSYSTTDTSATRAIPFTKVVSPKADKNSSAKYSPQITAKLATLYKELDILQGQYHAAQLSVYYFLLSPGNVYTVSDSAGPAAPIFPGEAAHKAWFNAGGITGTGAKKPDKGAYTLDALTHFVNLTATTGVNYRTYLSGFPAPTTGTYLDLYDATVKAYDVAVKNLATRKTLLDKKLAEIAAVKNGKVFNAEDFLDAKTAYSPTDKTDKSTNTNNILLVKNTPDKTFKWNLPPHIWSLPVNTTSVADILPNASAFNKHTTRRGILWTALPSADELVSGSTKGENKVTLKKQQNYGFQFIWNPSEITQNTSVNYDITPNASDYFATTAFAYPTSSTINLTIMLDRTNDFACFKGSKASVKDLRKYYSTQHPSASNDSLTELADDLLKYGTLADLEFLYRAINGYGWKNRITGRVTSDVGWLRPTMLGFKLGPNAFFCMVERINARHTYFTPTMIPLRTEVTLSLSLKSNVSTAQDASEGPNNTVPGSTSSGSQQ